VSYEILVEKHDVLQHSNDTDLQQWFNTNIGAFPMYYSTPSVREFIDMQGYYNVEMSFDNDLLDMLKRQLKTNNIGYLGNNEGWVNLKFRT
jgi:CRISPR-associated protein Cas5